MKNVQQINTVENTAYFVASDLLANYKTPKSDCACIHY